MIKTLVSIEADLASSLAIRFACQLGGLINMEIQPVYVKESATHDTSMGAGWASRTWEKELVRQGKEEIAELISAEKDFCPVLCEPRIIYGDRQSELLKIVQREDFHIFVEGVHFTWTPHDLVKKLHTKLYQGITFPAILVKALRKISTVQVLCLDVSGTRALTDFFQRVWKDCPVPLVLNFARENGLQNNPQELRDAVDQAYERLKEAGCTVTVQDTLPPHPGENEETFLGDSGLIALSIARAAKWDSLELQWLHRTKTSSLLTFR